MTTYIKPCPACDANEPTHARFSAQGVKRGRSNNTDLKGSVIRCGKCDLSGPTALDLQDAIIAWNALPRREEPRIDPDVKGALIRLLSDYDALLQAYNTSVSEAHSAVEARALLTSLK